MLSEFLNIDGISDLRDFCLKEGRVFEIRKDDFFIRKGEVPKFAGYIEKGTFRYIDYTTAGKTQIVGYSFQNDFVSDYGSLQNQIQADFYAQAMVDSIVYAITREEINQFYDNHKEPHLRSRIAESIIAELNRHFTSLHCNTPEERYLNILKRYPQLPESVSLKEIASFIGITPETLSRIRKKHKQE